jgi:hypothetical protein
MVCESLNVDDAKKIGIATKLLSNFSVKLRNKKGKIIGYGILRNNNIKSILVAYPSTVIKHEEYWKELTTLSKNSYEIETIHFDVGDSRFAIKGMYRMYNFIHGSLPQKYLLYISNIFAEEETTKYIKLLNCFTNIRYTRHFLGVRIFDESMQLDRL